MRNIFIYIKGVGLRALPLLLGFFITFSSASSRELRWEDVFKDRPIYKYIYFKAQYTDERGFKHQLEYWREGMIKLKRVTDGSLELYVLKREKKHLYYIVDKKRGILAKASRQTLYLMGEFSYNWNSLANNLHKPVGPYKLRKLYYKEGKIDVYRCDWYMLSYKNNIQRICWSKTLSIPLIIEDKSKRIVWKVDYISTKPFNENVFYINKKGLFRVNLDKGASPSAD